MTRDKNLNLRLTEAQDKALSSYQKDNKLKSRTLAGINLIRDGLAHNGLDIAAEKFNVPQIDLTDLQIKVMVFVREGENNAPKLSTAMQFGIWSARQLLRKLVEKKWATVNPPKNGKVPLDYFLTATGKKLIEGKKYEDFKEGV